ncbi:MAG: hypothetical protein KGR26_10530 [Cyanobacteria bacterium REEB65]|nr:hypothetical protein [Cyanobacteria bacterium REEB65]
MAFKRKETTIEATDLNTISPEEAEKRIIAGVKKYATNEANFAKADANTPYLGHIIGMGIESSNLADITMSIERQFLTKMTNRVPVAAGSADFKLEAGELGKLRILEGQDALAATPGLSVKMLMDLGHMPKNDSYLQKVVSFAYVTATGDGYRLNDSLKKAVAKVERLTGAERSDAVSNLKVMLGQAQAYEKLLSDPQALAAERRKTYENDKSTHDALARELSIVTDKIKGSSATNDTAELGRLRGEEAEIKTRLRLASAKLRVSEEVAREAGKRKPVEDQKVQTIRGILRDAIAQAEKIS